MAKEIKFKDLQVGDFFYIEGCDADYQKVSDTQGTVIVTDIMGPYEVAMTFSPDETVCYYPWLDDDPPEFAYFDDPDRDSQADSFVSFGSA